MAWKQLPQHQQRGSQIDRGAPAEAIKDRGAQQHDLADLQAAGTTEPRADVRYPAGDVTEEGGDNVPTLGDGDTQAWDDVVQPEARRPAKGGGGGGDGGESQPLPDGK